VERHRHRRIGEAVGPLRVAQCVRVDLDAVVWAEVPPPVDVRVPDLGPPGLSYFIYRPG